MQAPADELPPNVQEALRAGNAIEAIKLLREATGLGLKEAKDRIDAQSRQGAVPSQESLQPDKLPAQVMQALQAGNKIEAIRLLREQTGAGLKEAKDAVDRFQSVGTDGPGAVPRRSGLWWVVALGLAAALLYFFLRK